MVETYSPTGQEEKLAQILADELEKGGFTVEIDSVGNVIGVIEGERPRVLLCGHMDTVPPELPVVLDKDYIYGRGAVDAKGPLAALIAAATQLHDEGYTGALLVTGVVDEEGENAGVKQLIRDNRRADFAIFGEPTNVDTVTVGYKGSLLIEVKCETETGHSSAPWLFNNAIEKSYALWENLRDIRMPQEDVTSSFHSLTPCLLYMDARTVGSVVPPLCVTRIGFRVPPSIRVKRLEEEINRKVEDYRQNNPGVVVSVTTIDSVEPYLADRRSPLVKALSRAIWRHRRSQVGLINKTGTGDMNYYGPETGVPVITYGPGDSHLDHTNHEKLSIDDFHSSIKIIKEAIKDIKKHWDKTN